MYHYLIYGLQFCSEIKLYQLEQCKETDIDVHIKCGKVASDIAKQIEEGIASAMTRTSVWFRNDVGVFVISNGNEIFIQPVENATENDIASFVLGWCISFLFQQRGLLAIHCSALEMYGHAVFISGVSGAGKSTLAQALIERGYRYLADDIAMVNVQDDLMIQPAFPQQKVCRDVAEKMNEESLFYINEKKDKFAYINNLDFCTEPRKLAIMFLLEKHNGQELEFELTRGLAKWNGVAKNLFLLDAYRVLDFPPGERQRCLELAGKIDMYTIQRPEGKDTVEEICNRIIEIVKETCV